MDKSRESESSHIDIWGDYSWLPKGSRAKGVMRNILHVRTRGLKPNYCRWTKDVVPKSVFDGFSYRDLRRQRNCGREAFKVIVGRLNELGIKLEGSPKWTVAATPNKKLDVSIGLETGAPDAFYSASAPGYIVGSGDTGAEALGDFIKRNYETLEDVLPLTVTGDDWM